MKNKNKKDIYNKLPVYELRSATILICACVSLIIFTLNAFRKTGTDALMSKIILLITAILALTGIYIKLKRKKSNSLISFTSFAAPLVLALPLFFPVVFLQTFAPETAPTEFYCAYLFLFFFIGFLFFLLLYGRLISRFSAFFLFGSLYAITLFLDYIPNSELIVLILKLGSTSTDYTTVKIFETFYKACKEAILCYIIFETAIQEHSTKPKCHHKSPEVRIESTNITLPARASSKLFLLNIVTSTLAVSTLIVTHAHLKKHHSKKWKGH